MQITSTRFGEFDITDDRVITFPAGIPGFPQLRDVALIPASETDPFVELEAPEGLFFMQSTTDPDLAFLCVDPFMMFSEYEVEFDEDTLDIDDPTAALVLAVLSVIEGEEPLAARTTANLRAPIVVNTTSRQAQQVILSDARWSVKHPLGV